MSEEKEIKIASVETYFVRARCPHCCNREIIKYIPGKIRKCPLCQDEFKIGELK